MDRVMMSNVLNYQALFESVFRAFLSRKNVSNKTRKNYLSDIRRFIQFVFTQKQSLFSQLQQSHINEDRAAEVILSHVQSDEIEAYKQALSNSKTPPATINRHLSTIRIFFECTTSVGWTKENPAKHIKNISSAEVLGSPESILRAYEVFLLKEGASKNTIKQYVTDAEEFLQWIDTNNHVSQ